VPPSSESVSKPRTKSAANYFLLAACLGYSLSLKMEGVRYPETLLKFYQTTRRHVPEVNAVKTMSYV
jgi:hypothetical protein